MLKFHAPLIVVEDIARSRHFYETLLDQKVRFDFGVDVEFEGQFTIHQKDHFQGLLGGAEQYPITLRAHNGELYFDCDDLDGYQQRLIAGGAHFIHEIQEQPWGQRVMRLYDPDGHLLEIGETMQAAVQRFHGQGLPVEKICERTGMPRDFVEQVILDQAPDPTG